jgi:MFS family permease
VSPARPRRIVAVAVLAQTLALMDNTILNVALETLGDPRRGLAASPTDLAWIVDSYSLTLAGGSFAGGALADRYGPRRILIAGLALLALFIFLRLGNDNGVDSNGVDAQTTSGTEARLLTQPRFTGGATAMLPLFFGLAGQLFYAAFYLQGVRGLSALAAGAVMASAAAGIVLGNQFSPTVCRLLSARWCAVAGIVLSSLTFGSYVWFNADTPIAWLVLLLFVQGVGTGLVVSPLTGQTMAAVPPGCAGFGAAVISASRPIGSTLGVAVLGARYRAAILPALAGLPPGSRDLAAQSAEATRALAGELHRPALLAAADRAYLHAMDVTALWTGAASLIGALLVIRCLRSPEPAWETSRGHRPASPTDSARRG